MCSCSHVGEPEQYDGGKQNFIKKRREKQEPNWSAKFGSGIALICAKRCVGHCAGAGALVQHMMKMILTPNRPRCRVICSLCVSLRCAAVARETFWIRNAQTHNPVIIVSERNSFRTQETQNFSAICAGAPCARSRFIAIGNWRDTDKVLWWLLDSKPARTCTSWHNRAGSQAGGEKRAQQWKRRVCARWEAFIVCHNELEALLHCNALLAGKTKPNKSSATMCLLKFLFWPCFWL